MLSIETGQLFNVGDAALTQYAAENKWPFF